LIEQIVQTISQVWIWRAVVLKSQKLTIFRTSSKPVHQYGFRIAVECLPVHFMDGIVVVGQFFMDEER